jgi:ElaB/YqjD/DUF883 family membrane-anchored ribosome-binding protein
MADEINITTNDPEAMRAEIEQTRARMSETIDEIEGALIRKKEEIQDRLDVLSPVKENPWSSLGIIFGTGVLLGFATGGDDDEDDEEAEYDGGYSFSGGRSAGYATALGVGAATHLDAEERAEQWERRARRLLRIAREQEELLEDSPRRRAALRRDAEPDDVDDEYASDRLGDFREMIGDRIVDFVGSAIRGLARGQGIA